MTHTRPTNSDPLLECPSCGLPAEVTERFTLNGFPAPVEHVKIVCVLGHWYTPAVDRLPLAEPGQRRETAAAEHRAAALSRARHVSARGALVHEGVRQEGA